MKVSVIVAAYNAEKYLRETLDSLFCQSMKDYEVIVVDDGSADGTGEILAEYGRNYPALRVIRQENKGPSAARNTGLAAASGEYVYFFDADDILEPDALDALCGRAAERKADLVIARYDIFDRFRAYPVHELDCLVREKKIGKYDPRILWTFSLCNKLFRREIIEAFSLCFPPVSYSEDGAFLMEYVYRCRRITGLDKVVFHYRRAGGGENASITASPSPEKIRDYIEAHRRIEASMMESFRRDFSVDIRGYRNELIRKEIHILLNQFYARFWGMEEETASLLADEIEKKLAALDMKDISLLQNDHPEFSLERLPRGRAEALRQARFTAVLYGEPGQEDFRP